MVANTATAAARPPVADQEFAEPVVAQVANPGVERPILLEVIEIADEPVDGLIAVGSPAPQCCEAQDVELPPLSSGRVDNRRIGASGQQ